MLLDKFGNFHYNSGVEARELTMVRLLRAKTTRSSRAYSPNHAYLLTIATASSVIDVLASVFASRSCDRYEWRRVKKRWRVKV